MKVPGACAVTVVASTPSGPVSNVTGTLTVLPRTVVTVDDSGGADFLRIQDAVDFAPAGYTVFIFTGTYPENVVVRKELEIVGESRTAVLIDGRGLDGVTIAADRVVLHELTILKTHTGVLQIRTNNTRVYDTTIKDYDVGLFNEHTLNAWVAYNLITRGRIGVLTNVSYDDAIRWNEISFNSKYGAKSFNTRLRNCFNWNNLHANGIGYFHDPTSEYPPMEFDGNVLTGNGVGVKVENASSVTLTNNTFTGGSTGVQLLNSSSIVDSNTFAGVGVAVICRASGSNLTNNVIGATSAGIVCDGGAPRIEGNDVRVASGEAALDSWSALSERELREQLCELSGVGMKVANCVMLFAYERIAAFPIDVWIERVLRERYFVRGRKVTTKAMAKFVANYFGAHGGYAQQYLFHHARMTGKRKSRTHSID